MMSNKNLTTLYIGVTNNLERRVLQHKWGEASQFTKKYKLDHLVYIEEGESIKDAIAREKQLKSWRREWKWDLVKKINPEMKDLSEGWYDEGLLKKRDPESSSG
jgi:putative endonuclease